MTSKAAHSSHILTSAEQNIRSDNFELSGSIGGHNWSVRLRTLCGGRQDGVQVITVDNGALQIDIVPTRGMSILEARHENIRLGWESPVKEVVHPQFINLESRGGLGWLEGFNELVARCGLEFAGLPGTDEFINNAGDKATMDLTLHGKIGNTPASEVQVIVEEEPHPRIRVRGVVHERSFYGPKLRLVSEVSTIPGSAGFWIEDEVTNLAGFEQEFQLIYHTNFGPPLLGEGAMVHVAPRTLAPFNERAVHEIEGYATYAGPTKGFLEIVYLVEPYADAAGQTRAVLSNATGDCAVSMEWSIEELPYVTIWKNTAAKVDGYVTGIEPGTTYPFNRKVERRTGRLPVIAANESRQFAIKIDVHRDQTSIKNSITSVQQLQGDRLTEIRRTPPSGD